MNLLLIIIALTALTGLSWGALYLYEFVANDGYGRLRAHARPPRSHRPDPFDPNIRVC